MLFNCKIQCYVYCEPILVCFYKNTRICNDPDPFDSYSVGDGFPRYCISPHNTLAMCGVPIMS